MTAGVAVAVVTLTALAVVNVETLRLPDRLSYPAAGATLLAFAAGALVEGDGGALTRALLGGLAMAAVFFAVELAVPGTTGLGTVKSSATVGLGAGALGPSAWALALGATLGVLLVLAVASKLFAPMRAPSGPALLAGLVAAVVVHG